MSAPFTLGKGRIEALSDGVFSIAMTLLVLEIKIPELSHHQTNDEMLAMLLKLRPAFLAFFTTFLISGAFWFLHHMTFHFVKHMDRLLCWINLFFLMFVSLLPFSAGLLGHVVIHPVTQFFYFGNQLILALLLLTHWIYAQSQGLTDVESHPEQAAQLTWRISSMAVAFAAGLVFMPLGSSSSSIAFVISLTIINLIKRVVLRRRARNRA